VKKTALILIFALMFSLIADACSIKLAQADPYMYYEWVSPPAGSTPLAISIQSPNNNTLLNTNHVNVTLNISTKGTSIVALLDAYLKADWLQENTTIYKQNTFNPEFPQSWNYSETFSNIPDGKHNISIYAMGNGFYAANEVKGLTAYNFDMTAISRINFTIDSTPPKISIASPQNITYKTSDVPLNFTISENASLIKFSLDSQENSTWNGNLTLAGLPDGSHNFTLYAWDAAGNIGTSENVVFTVDKLKPPTLSNFTSITIALLSVSIAVACIALIWYFKRNKHPHFKSRS